MFIDTYRQFRMRFDVMDAIRMTASRHNMKPLDVAVALGLANYFISHR